MIRLRYLLGALTLLLAALAGCATPTTAPDATTPASLNHTHDLLALRGAPGVVLLATHYGLYRSADAGGHWDEVAGGSGQPMDGLMIYKLAQSPVDPLRVYTLAVQRTAAAPPAHQGLYTSADGGAHWALATPLSAFPNSAVYSMAAGAAGPAQVFAIDSTVGALGLYESDDAGSHWRALPAAPTSAPSGLLADPAEPAHLLLWSNSSGLYRSADSGHTWSEVAGITGGVYRVTQSGALVYAPGDAGLYVSTDSGATFSLVDQSDTFTTVIASASQRAYALGGTAVYTTTSTGSAWTETAALPHQPSVLAVDPLDPLVVYVAFSYPVGVVKTSDGGQRWDTAFP